MEYQIIKKIFPDMEARAILIPNKDGSFNIYVNARYPKDEQQEAVKGLLRKEWVSA